MNCLICKNHFSHKDTIIRMIVAQILRESNYEEVYSGLSEYGEVHLKCLENKINKDVQSESEDDTSVVRTDILGFLK